MRLSTFLPQCLFAIVLFVHGAAQALPTYHVSVDTTPYAGQGLLDFNFMAATAGATPTSAVLSNFSGTFGAVFDSSPGVSGTMPGEVVLVNVAFDYLTQAVNLGGKFGFDIRFDGDFATTASQDGSTFNLTLYNADFSDYIGTAGPLVTFELLPPVNGAAGGVTASSSPMATVAQVPEPSTLLLALIALPFCALARRSRGMLPAG